MDPNIFQDIASMIHDKFPNRKDPLILMMICKPEMEKIRLCADQESGYQDCLYLPIYTNKAVAEILAAARQELTAIQADPTNIDQWDAVAIRINASGEMQVSFNDDEIIDHWEQPELLF